MTGKVLARKVSKDAISIGCRTGPAMIVSHMHSSPRVREMDVRERKIQYEAIMAGQRLARNREECRVTEVR